MKKPLLIISTFAILLTACKKDKPISTNLTIDFTQTVDGENLAMDNIQYTNAANQDYSVKRLWYIISDITLHKDNGTTNLLKEVHFIDASNPSTLSFEISDLEDGNYTSISYKMGLDTAKNISNLYVNEDFHATMFWPDMMGGGYHYMKLDGNFDNDSTFYNTHTGGTMGVDYSFENTNTISLITDKTTSEANITINMEVNNWYQNPNTITLTTDEIMDSMEKQMKLKSNGADVFSTTIN